MADFCNKCAYEMWGDEIPPDIDVPKIFRNLEINSVYVCICEGCGLKCIVNHKNKLLLLFMNDDKETFDEWIKTDVKEYIIPKNKRRKLKHSNESI